MWDRINDMVKYTNYHMRPPSQIHSTILLAETIFFNRIVCEPSTIQTITISTTNLRFKLFERIRSGFFFHRFSAVCRRKGWKFCVIHRWYFWLPTPDEGFGYQHISDIFPFDNFYNAKNGFTKPGGNAWCSMNIVQELGHCWRWMPLFWGEKSFVDAKLAKK